MVYFQFALVTRRPYCPGRPEKLCFTTLSLAVETMGLRLGEVKQIFFGLPGQYGRRVTRANDLMREFIDDVISVYFRVKHSCQYNKKSITRRLEDVNFITV